MYISNIHQQINFNKRLEATAAIIKHGKPIPCNIYSLERDKDINYFKDLVKDYNWDCGIYTPFADDNINTLKNGLFYVMENQRGKCLGYTQISRENINNRNNDKAINILLLETCPSYASHHRRRKGKYIGETLIAFIAALAKRTNTDSVCVPYPAEPAYDFYTQNCDFEKYLFEQPRLILNRSKYDALLYRNEHHTKHKIEFKA